MKIGKLTCVFYKTNIGGDFIEIINGIEYREVTLRNRTKLISKDGDAINPIRRKQKCTIHYNSNGYPCFGGGVPIHLYVAHGWVEGYFEGAEVNHIDFDRTNCRADNLEWVSHSDNIAHSIKYNSDTWNKSKQGMNNGRATFTEKDVLKIRKMYDNGMKIADIVRAYRPNLLHSKDYKSMHSTFSNICKRKTWKHI